jgi:2-amino-4-hydroxy-6-hydroxymethyldihydropteridine diphosphokinase
VDGVAIPVAIALGSNLGEREATLHAAVDALRPFLQNLRISSFHDTAYIGAEVQAPVLNGAVVGETTIAAHPLLERLLEIERQFGRTRPYGGAPRTLDLDLILYGASVIEEPGLTVPHPRFRERRFVLEPLTEIAPDWRDPVTGKTMRELLDRLTVSG